MKLALTEDQRELQRTFRTLMEKECPPALVRDLQNPNSDGMPKKLWAALADTGLFGLAFPSGLGGEGGTLFELGLAYEEAGRVLCPPLVYSTAAFGLAMFHLGTREQVAEWIPRVARGEVRATMAAWQQSDASDVTPRVTATRRHGAWQLSGTLEFVPNADAADAILVTAKTADAGEPERVVGFVIANDQPGATTRRHRTFSRDIQCRVELNEVVVQDINRVVGLDRGGLAREDIQWVSNAVMALQCMEMVGGAQAVLERTVDYVKGRQQFNRPIASFQAAQHHVANMHIAIDGARLAAYQAVWWIGAGYTAPRELAIAKLTCNEAYKGVTLTAHQLHGGMGYLRETDLHLWSERAKVTELTGGPRDVQIKRLERALMLVPADG
jgi:alkylation response protein AidB-like acyl-CoA dehydrogenase